MAPKRKQIRVPRRINVRFKKKGDEEYAVGYTKNVSAGGLFIGTIRPLPPGTEIVVEIKEGNRLRQRPAMVVHAARVSPLLASVRTSGMGVRYLDLEESREATDGEQAKERDVTPAAQAPSQPEEEATVGPVELEIDLTSVERFREAFRRDIQHGLIFAGDPGDLEIGQEVVIRILPPGQSTGIDLRSRADRQTICRSEAYGELGQAGFMLIFIEADQAISQLRAFL